MFDENSQQTNDLRSTIISLWHTKNVHTSELMVLKKKEKRSFRVCDPSCSLFHPLKVSSQRVFGDSVLPAARVCIERGWRRFVRNERENKNSLKTLYLQVSQMLERHRK